MRIPRNWENTQAYDGNYERMTAGGHICRIMSARVDEVNGSEMLVLALEIAEGSNLDGFYGRDHKQKKAADPNAKWGCVFRQFILTRDGDCSPYFKGLIKCVEDSNSGYRWGWQEETLKGKLVGVIFREEEFLKTDSSIGTIIRPAFIRTVAKIREGVEVPEIKRINGRSNTNGGNVAPVQSTFVQVDDDELPF